jgi:hypothetical protein
MSELIENPVVKTLDDLFDRTTTYRIPMYQRDFSWGSEEVEEFLDDVFSLGNSDGTEEHFFGTLVLSKNSPGEPGTPGDKVRFVIDGQQRLTTSLLFFAAVKHQFESLADHQREAIREVKSLDDLLHIGGDDLEHQVARLSANRLNQDFLEATLTSRTKLPSDVDEAFANLSRERKQASKKMKDAYDKINLEVARHGANILSKELNVDDHLLSSLVTDPSECDALLSHFRKICLRLRSRSAFVEITVRNWQDAFSLFDGLNNRGLDLAKRDIVKNYVLACASDREREPEQFARLLERWKDIERYIPESKFGAFLRHYLLLDGEGVSLKSAVRTFIKKTDGKTADSIISTLGKAAEYYAAIISPDQFEQDVQIRKQMQILKTLSVERSYPIILASKLGGVTKNQHIDLMHAIEVMYFRRSVICQMDNKELEPRIQSIAAKIYSGGSAAVTLALEEIDRNNPPDAEFVALFNERRGISHAIARYLLMKIENHLRPGHNIESTSLEHILPQNPWTTWGLEQNEFNENLISRLGNLTLLAANENSSLSNSDFTTKKRHYLEEGLKINHQVVSAESWTEVEIKERQKWLSTHIAALWPRVRR